MSQAQIGVGFMNIIQSNHFVSYNEIFFIAIIFLLSVWLTPVSADSVYVSSVKAKVFMEPDFRSSVVTELRRSSKVFVLQKKGRWVQVSLNEKKGWLSAYAVSDTFPIQQRISIFSRIKNFFKSNSGRNRVSVVSTAGGIRGLSDEEVNSSGNSNFESLAKLESIEITHDELEEFVGGSEK